MPDGIPDADVRGSAAWHTRNHHHGWHPDKLVDCPLCVAAHDATVKANAHKEAIDYIDGENYGVRWDLAYQHFGLSGFPSSRPDTETTKLDPQTMNLKDLLRDYQDGDEHGWDVEFQWLHQNHQGQLDMLATSIQETGMHTPILLGNDGRVWDGHHRLCVAEMLGLDSVPVSITPEPSTEDGR